MDDLQFRRQAYGDPNNQSDDFLQHMASHPDDAKLVKELKALDTQLTQALNIAVPDDLAEKLLLRQQLNQHRQSQKRTRYLMAMAASIAFIVGVSFSMLRFTPIDLSEHALAHVYHETKALQIEQDIGFNDVNFKLASMSGLQQSKFIQQPGRVFYTAYCDFQGVKSLHLVMQDENGQKGYFTNNDEDVSIELDGNIIFFKVRGVTIDNISFLVAQDFINYVYDLK